MPVVYLSDDKNEGMSKSENRICYSLSDKLYDRDEVLASTMCEKRKQVCITCETYASDYNIAFTRCQSRHTDFPCISFAICFFKKKHVEK